MGIKTQIRLAQLTGSFGNVQGKIRDDEVLRASFALTPTIDLSGSLSEIASSIRRMNGHATFNSNAKSTLKDYAANTRIVYADGAGTIINQEDGAAAALTIGSTGTDKTVTFGGNAAFPNNGQIGSAGAANLMVLGASGLNINGNLTVTGTTTTIDTTNLHIQDKLILINDGDQSKDSFGGIAIASGSNDDLQPDMFFGRVAQEVFGAVRVSSNSGSISALPGENLLTTGMKQIPIQGSKFYVSGSTNNIAVIEEDSNKLGITGAVAVTANAPAFEIMNSVDGNPGQLKIFEAADNGGSSVGFQAPALGGNLMFTLPTAFPGSTQALTSTDAGVLSFVSVPASFSTNTVKVYATLAADRAVSTNLALDTGFTATDFSYIAPANATKGIDVFVNGQLLKSGSSGAFESDLSAASFTSGDYLVKFPLSAMDIKFAFALEKDDVVCVIGRPIY